MFRKLIYTRDNSAGLIARLFLAAVILPHGLQKLFGLFGGSGFSGTIDYFVGMGIPAILAFLIIIGESFGSLALVFGFLSRFCATAIGLIMLGAVYLVHLQHGFFMNWYGNKTGEGFEFHLLALGLIAVILAAGSGKWSVDRVLSNRLYAEGHSKSKVTVVQERSEMTTHQEI